jgi:hypothetical protein
LSVGGRVAKAELLTGIEGEAHADVSGEASQCAPRSDLCRPDAWQPFLTNSRFFAARLTRAIAFGRGYQMRTITTTVIGGFSLLLFALPTGAQPV